MAESTTAQNGTFRPPGWTQGPPRVNLVAMATVRWPKRPWRRFWFLQPELGSKAVLGCHGPLIGAAGVVSMAVLGSSDVGRVSASTYRGRPPRQAELENVQAFNMTDPEGPRSLPYLDGEVQVDGQPITARMAFVPASANYNTDRWAVLLFGADYSATISLDGLTPDRIVLTMVYDDAGYTDMKTAVRHHPI